MRTEITTGKERSLLKLRIMKVAIYSRVVDFEHYAEVQHLFDELRRQSIQVCIFQPFFDHMFSKVCFPEEVSKFVDSGDLDDSFDFVISLGGDGTLLDTVTLVRDKNI